MELGEHFEFNWNVSLGFYQFQQQSCKKKKRNKGGLWEISFFNWNFDNIFDILQRNSFRKSCLKRSYILLIVCLSASIIYSTYFISSFSGNAIKMIINSLYKSNLEFSKIFLCLIALYFYQFNYLYLPRWIRVVSLWRYFICQSLSILLL